MRFIVLLLIFTLGIFLGGCPAAVVGGAAGGYKVATDERTAGGLWDDATIASKVKNALIKDERVKARKVDVDVVDGIVTLTGLVGTKAEVKRAVEVAGKVPHVKGVKNNLQVGTRTFGEAIDDQLIRSKIKTKLIGEPGIKSLNIDVDVLKGVVTLTGIVETKRQEKKVIELARSVAGVVKVVDNITVR